MKPIHLLIFIALLCGRFAFYQSDWSTWDGVRIECEFNKDLTANIETEIRADNNFSRPYLFFITPEVRYDLNNYFRAGVNYRFSNQISDHDISHRGTIQIELRNIIKLIYGKSRFDATFRIRGTKETSGHSRPETYLRPKLAVDYNIPGIKLTPKFTTELFYRFNEQLVYTYDEVIGKGGWDKCRLRLGLSYPLGNNHEIDCFYQFQNSIPGNQIDQAIGFNYAYKFKYKKKRPE